MASKIDVRIGQFLIQKQWCTLKQVAKALNVQDSQKGAARMSLGRILVAHGVIAETRLKQALAEMGILVLRCQGCNQEYSVSEFDPAFAYTCHDCSKPLDLCHAPADMAQLIPYHSSSNMVVSATTFDPEFVGPQSQARRPAKTPDPSGEARDPFIGKVFGGCKLLEKIAAGGMGIVYKAHQLNLNRLVAVKLLSRDLASDDAFVRRFIEEARSAAQLNHANIVHVIDVGDQQGVFYFTMEHVDGVNLKTLLQERNCLPVSEALRLTLQICNALHHAHERGIIHRDIKPENIMIAREGVAKLADLGLSKRITPSGVENVTQAGSILGTPFYMAPEQAKDFSRVDSRSDIYSLGVLLFKAISGKVPFNGRTPIEVMIKAIDGKRPALRDLCQDVPEEVELIVDRMMHRLPEERYQSVAAVMVDIEAALANLDRVGEGAAVARESP